jgi:acetyltransferase-like isoleucine patch superfamily enzyme
MTPADEWSAFLAEHRIQFGPLHPPGSLCWFEVGEDGVPPVSFREYAVLDTTGTLKLGKDISISRFATVYTHRHNIHNRKSLKECPAIPTPLEICDGVQIGDKAIVLGGVGRIGVGAVIGAGAVVTKPVPDWEIWVGNPAHKSGERK